MSVSPFITPRHHRRAYASRPSNSAPELPGNTPGPLYEWTTGSSFTAIRLQRGVAFGQDERIVLG